MSSKRRIRRRGCQGKRRHRSFADAKAHLAQLARAGRMSGSLHPYKCVGCGFVHVGHDRGQLASGAVTAGRRW